MGIIQGKGKREMQQFVTHSPEETERAAADFARRLRPGDVVAFTGGMGMGKTCFVRGMASVLCPKSGVSSPTFSLVNEYGGEIPLYHFDMYRVTSLDDLYSTGFFDYLGTDAILAIEWSENIVDALPENTIWVRFQRLGDKERKITVEGDERF